MQEDGKIHIPARSKQPVDQQTVVNLSPEAYNVLVESAKRVVYDKES